MHWCHRQKTREGSGPPPQIAVPNFSITNNFFVVLLALVDAHYKFKVVDIESYGRNSDVGIFAHSELGKYLETHLGIPEGKQLPGISCLAPHVIVGYEAFPLKTDLTFWIRNFTFKF